MKIKLPKVANPKVRFNVYAFFLVTAILTMLNSSFVYAQKKDETSRPKVGKVAKFDLSPPLSSIQPNLTPVVKAEDDQGMDGPVNDTRHDVDPVVQRLKGYGVFSQDAIPGTNANFDGLLNTAGISPPDPVGDVGPNHYIQMVNSRFQIFTRAGVSVYGPANINTLFAGFGGACQTRNDGDPVVLHDQFANRWVLLQFTSAAPYFNCMAISATSDPLGAYYRFAIPAPIFPDYPKFGIWGDGYYLTTREIGRGIGAYVINREQILAGNPNAAVVSFVVPSSQAFRGGDGLLPADADGVRLPPAGTPNYMVGTMDSGGPYNAPADALNIYKFQVDWNTPANSTFTFHAQVETEPFDSVFPCSGGSTPSRNCIPQPGTAVKLDVLSYRQRPLHRLAYRNFGTHESLVTLQAVEAAPGVAGQRWYEIRNLNTTPTIYQQGTYAPNDGVHRWMGSIAMDNQGNMGMAYSVSNGTDVFPGIRYTGRLASDPLGTMPQGEGTIINGAGSQTSGGSRWGDYSSINVDPVDDCTFWYTTEYYAATSTTGWRTRVGSFKFPSCSAPAISSANIAGRVLSVSGRGLSGVRVTLTGGSLTAPLIATTNAFGYYRFNNLQSGVTYNLTAQGKKYTFTQPTRVLNFVSNSEDVNFISQ